VLGQAVGLALGYAAGRRAGFNEAVELASAREGQMQAAHKAAFEQLRDVNIQCLVDLHAQAAPYLCPPSKVECN
jgi:flagellar biosynthesis/type III secretory pathway protein FliH